MKQTNRFWKLVFITCGITLTVVILCLWHLWRLLSTDQANTLCAIANEHPLYILIPTVFSALALFTGLEAVYAFYIKPIKKICAEAAMIYSSNPSHRLEINGNRDINQLRDVINDFADLFENLNKGITDQILSARQEIEKERNLLAAIMAELPQGVIICNQAGRILLFNSLAKKIFSGASHDQPEYFLGLGRSIYHLIDREQVQRQLDRLQKQIDYQKPSISAQFFSLVPPEKLVCIETIPVLDQDRNMTGFIFTLEDVTDNISQYNSTNEKLKMIHSDINSCLTQIKTLVPAEDHNALEPSLEIITHQYENLSGTVLNSLSAGMILPSVRIMDIITPVKRSLESFHIWLDVFDNTKSSRVLADVYSFTNAMVFLIKELSRLTGVMTFTMTVDRIGDRIQWQLGWSGTPALKHRVEALQLKKMDPLPNLRYLWILNKAVLLPECDGNGFCLNIVITARAKLTLPENVRKQSPVMAVSRPEFYDFDLFDDINIDQDFMNTHLGHLSYTVFDTETTGLNPDGGDEIISIAAVRIVNSRISYQDIFEELIDPKREIPMESYKIHGINYEMVAGKKDIISVLPNFKNFTEDTVLIGHNIAFDMKMLKVKEKISKVTFSNPVLDTLLLSAVLHPVHERHDLESIAKRLGIEIVGRHTALGDAVCTAKIFLKLLPMLYNSGVFTLKDAVKASKKTYYARLRY